MTNQRGFADRSGTRRIGSQGLHIMSVDRNSHCMKLFILPTTQCHAILLSLRLLRLLRLREIKSGSTSTEGGGIEVEELGVGQEVQTLVVQLEVILRGGVLL